jgi:hypothetical protein
MYDVKRRAAAIAVSALAISAALAGPAAAAGGKPGTGLQLGSPTNQAAGWLVNQLVGPDKDHFTFPGSDYADDGNTADGLLALDAAGVAHEAAARMLAWLQTDAANYAGFAPNYYPGSLAKLLIVAEAENVDLHDFGGIDLVTSLIGTENTGSDPTLVGLYQNPDAQYGYESTITQALALIALSNTGTPADAPSTAAVQWLLDQQCPDGGFRNNETPHTPTGCTSDLETTAFAVQGLVEVGQDVSSALDWLDGQQNGDGGFGSPKSNANATAVAAQAFLAANQEPTNALLWLRDQQVGCAVDNGADQDAVGAITFDDSGYDHDSALRATTQALQAIALNALAMVDAGGAVTATPDLVFCYAAGGGSGPGGNGDGGNDGGTRGDGGDDDGTCAAGSTAGRVVAGDPETADADPESIDADPESSAAGASTLASLTADSADCPEVLAVTGGRFPAGPAAGIAVDCLVVGTLMAIGARRRRAVTA